jgi:iron complex transport system substrate-binding protein
MVLRRWLLVASAIVAFGGSYALKRTILAHSEPGAPPSRGAARIVSLAPSITETLFEMGLGDRIVGVTRYCLYPPEARTKPQIGGYYDPNFEAVAASRPDLVLTLTEHADARSELGRLGLSTLTLDHATVAGILSSVLQIGRACGCPGKAAALHERLSSRLKKIAERTSGRPRPRVLISVGRMSGDASTGRITVCGRKGLFEELIELAGGRNAFERDIDFPALSAEGVLEIHPDVIVDLWPDLKEKGLSPEAVRAQWKRIPGLEARISVIGESYAMIPGPRIVLLLEDLSRALHPEETHD